MNILVLNGSPKGEKSNTMQLTNAFLTGLCERQDAGTEILPIYQMNIKPCIGCFSCWSKTPGKCCLSDDMAGIITKILEADVIVWSFPLYYFALPSQLKAVMDRLLPMNLPFMTGREDGNSDSGAHPPRYDLLGKRYVVISTCGFYTAADNYDAVLTQFDRLYGKQNFETILCGQGELFREPALRNRTEEYLTYVKNAGAEFAGGTITTKTKESLKTLLYPRELFEQMADASWGIEAPGQNQPAQTVSPSLTFTKQMAALYNKSTWNGKDKILEMYYTDLCCRYQVVLGEKGSTVLTDQFLSYTTKIETPFPVWQAISRGELDGQEAMMERLYRVEGDFDLMLHWDQYFGGGTAKNDPICTSNAKTNMTLLLLPWLVIWVVLAINQVIGGILGIAACAVFPLLYLKYKPTIFEGISTLFVGAISILSLFSVSSAILLPISYLIFGLMWTTTVFLRKPLTCYYSMNEYGGEKALSNPLFIRTNRILTAAWGVLYLVTPLWTYYLMLSALAALTGAVNSILPALLGIFTLWFQKWYPAYYARKS